MVLKRRTFIKAAFGALVTGLAPASFAMADTYPSHPIWIVVPWPAGAGTDIVARAVADALTRDLGVPVQVENKPGANGAIGTNYVAKAAPDGYTLVAATADTHTINPQVRQNLPYDAVHGFTPLCVWGTQSFAWIARPDLPANSLQEFISMAKSKPRQFTYGSWGMGSTAHLAGATLENAAGIELNHVPFQGSAPAVTALQGGHIDILPTSKITADLLLKAGKVKVLAVSSAERTQVLADVPTVKEVGLAGAVSGSWYGLMAPKGLPDPVKARLDASLAKVLASPALIERIRAIGFDPVDYQGEQLGTFLKSEYDRYGAIIQKSAIKVD